MERVWVECEECEGAGDYEVCDENTVCLGMKFCEDCSGTGQVATLETGCRECAGHGSLTYDRIGWDRLIRTTDVCTACSGTGDPQQKNVA